MEFSYSKVEPTAIGKSLERMFSADDSSQVSFTSASHFNAIVPLSSGSLLKECDAFIELVGQLHPSRFFIVCLDAAAKELETWVAASCYLIPGNKSAHLCSEVVRIVCTPQDAPAAMSIIRGNLMPSIPTEAFLYDPLTEPEMVRFVTPLCDRVYLDSSSLAKQGVVSHELLKSSWEIIDLEWFALAAWRDAVRESFSFPILSRMLGNLESIEIKSEWINCQICPESMAPCSALLTSWFVSRLGLSVAAAGKTGFECVAKNGRRLLISVKSGLADATARERERGPFARLSQVRMVSSLPERGKLTVTIERSQSLLEVEVSGFVALRFTKMLEDESRGARLGRFFSIGESTINYRHALRLASELEGMRAAMK